MHAHLNVAKKLPKKSCILSAEFYSYNRGVIFVHPRPINITTSVLILVFYIPAIIDRT